MAQRAITTSNIDTIYSTHDSPRIGATGPYIHLPRHSQGTPMISLKPASAYPVQFNCLTNIIIGPGASFSAVLYLPMWRVLAAGMRHTHMAIDIGGTPRVVYDDLVFIIAPDYRLRYWAEHISGNSMFPKTAVISTYADWSNRTLCASALRDYDIIILSAELVTSPPPAHSLHGGLGALHRVSAGLVVVDDACNTVPNVQVSREASDRPASRQYVSTGLKKNCKAIAGLTSTAGHTLFVHELPNPRSIQGDQLAMMFAMVGRATMGGKTLTASHVTNGAQYISTTMDRDSGRAFRGAILIIDPYDIQHIPNYLPKISLHVISIPADPLDDCLCRYDYTTKHAPHLGREGKAAHVKLLAAASNDPLALVRVAGVQYPASIHVTMRSTRKSWSTFDGCMMQGEYVTSTDSEIAIRPDQTVQHAVLENLFFRPLLVDPNRNVLVVIDPQCYWEWRTLPAAWARLLTNITNKNNYELHRNTWPKLVKGNLDRSDVRGADIIVCFSCSDLRVTPLVAKLVSRACQVGRDGVPAITCEVFSFVIPGHRVLIA